MTSPHIMQQADNLKASVADTSSGSNEAWVSRQALQDLYQKLLVIDLEFALDKKVEQDLWNHAFKNQITVLQNQAKDKQNPKRGEIQSSLNLFLETAGGFYLQLLQELCSAFKLDLPFRRKSSNFGILKEYDSISAKIRMPKTSSSMYICQHCLVHLGDIARYRQQIDQAQSYYRHAAHLVPYNGQPYNQLAILEAAKSNKLSTVFYYARSIAVKHPFPVASTNLDKFYTKIGKETLEYRGKLSMSETISTFLQFHAFIHLDSDVDKARKHGERLIVSLPTHITSTSFSSYQLVQMAAVNMFAIYHALHNPAGEGGGDGEDGQPDPNSSQAFSTVFDITMSMMEQLVYNTPKQEQKAKDYHTLPALKIILDWLLSKDSLMAQHACRNSGIWGNLSKLLNNLQFHGGQKDVIFDPDKYASMPLPEDCDLQCFLPMLKAYTHIDFTKSTNDVTSGETEVRLRCQRLVEHGRCIADNFSRLNLLTYTQLKSGRLQFSSPLGTVKLLGNTETNPQKEHKHIRSNVAIETILQNIAKTAHKETHSDQSFQPGEGSHRQKHFIEGHGTDSNILPHGVLEKQQYQQFSQYEQSYHKYSNMPYQQQQQQQQQQQGSLAGSDSGDVGSLQPGPAVRGSRRSVDTTNSTLGVAHQTQLAGPPGTFSHGPLDSQGSLRPMTHQQTLAAYRMPGGGSPRSSLDLSAPPHSHKAFQPAPGSGLSPGSQPSLAQVGPFSGQVTAPPDPSTHLSPAPGGLHPASVLHQFTPTPGYPARGSYTGGGPQYVGANYPGPTGEGMHVSSGYGPSFPRVSAPSPQITQALSNTQNSILSLLSTNTLPSTFTLPSAMLDLASADVAGLPAAGGLGQGGQLDSFLHLREDEPGLGYTTNQGLAGYPIDNSNRRDMLQREEFNKDEPELKFTELDSDASFPSSLALGLSGLSVNDQSHAKMIMPDSPSNASTNISSLFSLPADAGLGAQTNSYSLFSKSPWTVQLSKADSNKSLSSSPFGSGEDSGSLRNTPDPLGDLADVPPLPSAFPMGYTFGSPDSNWTNQPSANRPDDSNQTDTLLSSSIQSLWSPGPSPLEKLLEQQKQQQRHLDPH